MNFPRETHQKSAQIDIGRILDGFFGKTQSRDHLRPKKMNSHSPFDGGCIVAPRPYPARIEQATCRAIDARIAAIRALSLDARFMLVQFVRSVSLKCLSTSVRIRNSTLCAVLDCGVKKVCALKTELEAAGWIVREQEKSRARGMQVSDVWLTPWALQMLGLSNGNLEHPAMPVPSEQELASDAFIPPAHAAPFFKAEKREFSRDESTLYLSTTPSERQLAAAPHGLSEQETSIENQQPTATAPKAYNDVIPDDLIPLRIAGISVPRIRMLMRMASKVGKRLGHIVEVAAANILEADNPFRYAASLINNPTDWAAKRAALHKEQRKHKAKKANQQADNRATIAQAMQCTGMITSYKRTHVWKLDDEGTVRRAAIAQVATTQLVDWMPLADMAAFAEAVREGKFFAVDMQDVRDMAGIDPLSEDCSTVPLEQAPAHSDLDDTYLPADDGQKAASQPVQPTEATSPIDAALQTLQTVASQSPDGLLASSKHTKVWKIIDGWLKVTTVQELLNTKTAIIHWLPLSAEGVIDFANRLKQGQLFPVDRQTVQSWCPTPQPAPVQSAMRASTATANRPDGPSPQSTGTQSWRTSLANLLNTAQGPFHGAGA